MDGLGIDSLGGGVVLKYKSISCPCLILLINGMPVKESNLLTITKELSKTTKLIEKAIKDRKTIVWEDLWKNTFFEEYEHYEKCGVIKNTISVLYEQSVKQISSNKLFI